MIKIILILFINIFSLNFKSIGNEMNIEQSVSQSVFEINSSSCILIDASNSKIIYSKNEHNKLAPASMTKLMGLYLFFEGLEENRYCLEDVVSVSKNAASNGGSQVYLEENEKITVEDLLKSVAISSANDSMVALAELHSGSEEGFIHNMNKKAQEFNMTNTNYVNTTGFDDKNHYTTSFDMSLLMTKLLNRFDDIFIKYSSIKEDYIRKDSDKPFWLVNTNKLLNKYDYIDCGKTGYTSNSKYCLTTSAKKNNVRLIAVTMKANTKEERNQDIIKLFNYGFRNTQALKVFDKNQIIMEYSFNNTEQKCTPLYVKEEIYITGDFGIKKEDIEIFYEIQKNEAPIKKDEIVGQLIIKHEEYEYYFDLYSSNDVEALTFIKSYVNSLLKLLFN